MASNAFKRAGTLIGCRNVCFAKITQDDSTGTTYSEEIMKAPGVIEIALSAQVTNEVLGADDVTMYDILSSLDGFDVSLTMASLGDDGSAYLLGNTIDEKGVRLEKSDDVAPYVAMGFETMRSDKSYDYIWLYKGKFAPSDMTFRTKEKGAANWQTPTLTASFAPRVSDKLIRGIVNSANETAKDILTSFFETVYNPSLTAAATQN